MTKKSKAAPKPQERQIVGVKSITISLFEYDKGSTALGINYEGEFIPLEIIGLLQLAQRDFINKNFIAKQGQ